MSKQVSRKGEQNIKQLTDNNSAVLPLIRNFGISKRNENTISQTATLIEVHKMLSNFQLNKNEANVYLFLIRFGAQKAIRISENLGIPRSETCKILRSLESQGIVLRLVEKPYKYLAIPLEDIFDMFIQKKYFQVKKIEIQKEDLLTKWSAMKQPIKTENKGMIFQVLEGTNQIYIKLRELLDASKQSFLMATSDDILLWLYNTPFFELIESRNNGTRALNVKLITDNSETSTFVLDDVNKETFDCAIIDNWGMPGFFISDTNEIILLIRNGIEELYAMWTNYDALVKSNQLLFTMIWLMASNQLPQVKTINAIEMNESIAAK